MYKLSAKYIFSAAFMYTCSLANALTLPIIDDFNSTTINSNLWISSSVTQHDGYLDIQSIGDSKTGWIKTIIFSPAPKIRLEVIHTMHWYDNNIWPDFNPGFRFISTKSEGNFSIIFGQTWNSNSLCDNNIKITTDNEGCYSVSNFPSTDYYDRPIKTIITYDTTNGEIGLDIDGDGNDDLKSFLPQLDRFPIVQLQIPATNTASTFNRGDVWQHIDNFKLTSSSVEIGGTVKGVQTKRVDCKNVRTGQIVTIKDKAQSWNCEAAGLIVNTGDSIVQTVRGNAVQK